MSSISIRSQGRTRTYKNREGTKRDWIGRASDYSIMRTFLPGQQDNLDMKIAPYWIKQPSLIPHLAHQLPGAAQRPGIFN